MLVIVDFFGIGMMVVVLKQTGTVDCARERLEMSVKVEASWLAQASSPAP